MSVLERIGNILPAVVQTIPDRITFPSPNQLQALTEFRQIGNEITIYPHDGGERYIDKGYRRNDAVYAIVSTNAAECSQVRLYHMKVKREESKTAMEYLELKKGPVNNHVLKELTRMKKSMVENFIVDSPLARLLNKPNRYQTQSEWIEDIVGLRELQGEGNVWLNIPDGRKAPIEMMNIPKPQLNLIGNSKDPWEILFFEFVMSGNRYRWAKDLVVMWKYANPSPVDAITLEHLRGMAPLQAGIVLAQGMNEGDVRIATSNKNGGAAGLAYRETAGSMPTVEQMTDMRRQFNSAVNSNEMANKIAIMAGKWGYHSFSTTVKDQQLLEQYGIGFKRLCRIFKTPSQIFDEGNGTWDNQKQAYRRWIYSKIGPLIHGLCGKLNDALLSKFELDPERNLIDGDIMTLPAMSKDLKEAVEALQNADFLTDNEKRSAAGYEPLDSPVLNMTEREYEALAIGGNLDEDMKLLNG